MVFQRAPRKKNQRMPGFFSKNLSELPSREASAQGGSCCLSVQSRGRARLALGGDVLRHSLLLVLSPVVCVVWAAAATATTAASVLFGQQALPLGFVVCEMA